VSARTPRADARVFPTAQPSRYLAADGRRIFRARRASRFGRLRRQPGICRRRLQAAQGRREIAFIHQSARRAAPAYVGKSQLVATGSTSARSSVKLPILLRSNRVFTGTTRRDNAAARDSPRIRSLRADGAIRDGKLAVEAGADGKSRASQSHIASASSKSRRLGGDSSLAPHRAEAFEACRFAIDRLKEIVRSGKKNTSKAAKYGSAAKPRIPRARLSDSPTPH